MEMEIIARCKSTLKIGGGIPGVTETQAPSLRKSITEDHTNHINDTSNGGNSSGSSDGGDNSSSKSKSSSGGNHPVGLRILIHRSQKESNIVNKFMFINQPSPPSPTISPTISSFLKACHLCKKQLSPNKDIYMYRGDQGFCSVECRCRQMLMDEYEEMEDRCSRERNRRKKLQSPSPQYRRSNRIRETTRPTKGIPALA